MSRRRGERLHHQADRCRKANVVVAYLAAAPRRGCRLNMSQELEIQLLLEAIFRTYHYDFRQYAPASLKRRLTQAVAAFECGSVSGLQELVLHDRHAFPRL